MLKRFSFLIIFILISQAPAMADVRVCVEKSTGKFIEMQSHARAGTLIGNAVSSGYSAEDVEERVVTMAEYRAMLPIVNTFYLNKTDRQVLESELLTSFLPSLSAEDKAILDAYSTAFIVSRCLDYGNEQAMVTLRAHIQQIKAAGLSQTAYDNFESMVSAYGIDLE